MDQSNFESYYFIFGPKSWIYSDFYVHFWIYKLIKDDTIFNIGWHIWGRKYFHLNSNNWADIISHNIGILFLIYSFCIKWELVITFYFFIRFFQFDNKNMLSKSIFHNSLEASFYEHKSGLVKRLKIFYIFNIFDWFRVPYLYFMLD